MALRERDVPLVVGGAQPVEQFLLGHALLKQGLVFPVQFIVSGIGQNAPAQIFEPLVPDLGYAVRNYEDQLDRIVPASFQQVAKRRLDIGRQSTGADPVQLAGQGCHIDGVVRGNRNVLVDLLIEPGQYDPMGRREGSQEGRQPEFGRQRGVVAFHRARLVEYNHHLANVLCQRRPPGQGKDHDDDKCESSVSRLHFPKITFLVTVRGKLDTGESRNPVSSVGSSRIFSPQAYA